MRAFRATAFRFLTLTAMSVGSGLTFAALARAEDAPAAGDAGQGQTIDANALLEDRTRSAEERRL